MGGGRGGLTESAGAAVGSKTMVWKIWSVVRSMPISLGPPYAAGTMVPLSVAARPVSRIQRRSAGSMTTLWTPMR